MAVNKKSTIPPSAQSVHLRSRGVLYICTRGETISPNAIVFTYWSHGSRDILRAAGRSGAGPAQLIHATGSPKDSDHRSFTVPPCPCCKSMPGDVVFLQWQIRGGTITPWTYDFPGGSRCQNQEAAITWSDCLIHEQLHIREVM